MKKAAILTSLAAFLFLLEAAASAQTPNTDWYTANPSAKSFTISTADELAGLAQLVNDGNDFSGDTIRLAKNIDLSDYSTGQGWIPIGRYFISFNGTFNGGGHIISNLTINRTAGHQGLFGHIRGGRVENLGLDNVNINTNNTGNRNYGAIAGEIGSNSSVVNCYSTGIIRSTSYVGGLVGYATYNSKIANSYSTCVVSGNSHVGGVVGILSYNSIVTNCYSTGTVTGGRNVGGVAGAVTDESQVISSAALNDRVRANIADVGRVVGQISRRSTLSNNVAYSRMEPLSRWDNKGSDNLDGHDIPITSLKSDWTIGGRFIAENGWSIEPGWLFEFADETVLLPSLQAITTSVNPQFRQRQIQSSSAFNMRISPARNSITNISYTLNTESTLSISVYNLKGKKIASLPKRLRAAGNYNFSFKAPKGFYIVEARIQEKPAMKEKVYAERILVK